VGVGDSIGRDETIVEVSSLELDVELPSPVTGTVAELLVSEGDTAAVGQVIARVNTGDGSDGGAAGVREPRGPLPRDEGDEAWSDA